MFKHKPMKNYVILILIFALGMGITIYLCNWYDVYDEYQKQTPVIEGLISEITTDELEHYLLENPSTTLYICASNNDTCRSYEEKLKKLLETENLGEDIVYLNLKDIDVENFIADFNNKYPYRKALTTNYPAYITFEDGKVKYILQSDTEKLTIAKTKQYFELNHIGE